MKNKILFLLFLDKGRREVLWLIKLRKAPREEKLQMILKRGEENAQSIIRRSWMLSDEDLQWEVTQFDEEIEYFTNEIDINQIL